MRSADTHLTHPSEGLSGLPLCNLLDQCLVAGHLSRFQALVSIHSVEGNILAHVSLVHKHKFACRLNL